MPTYTKFLLYSNPSLTLFFFNFNHKTTNSLGNALDGIPHNLICLYAFNNYHEVLMPNICCWIACTWRIQIGLRSFFFWLDNIFTASKKSKLDCTLHKSYNWLFQVLFRIGEKTRQNFFNSSIMKSWLQIISTFT